MKRLLTIAAVAALAAAPAHAQNAARTRTEVQAPAVGQVRTRTQQPGQIGGRTTVGTIESRTVAGRPTGVNDALFAAAAADSGLSELTLSQLGVQRATDPELKQFSQKMIEEHTRMNSELTQLAAREGMRIPEMVDVRSQFCARASPACRARSSTAAMPRPSSSPTWKRSPCSRPRPSAASIPT